MTSAAVYRLIFSTILLAMGAGYIAFIAHYFGRVPMASINTQEMGLFLFLALPGFICMILALILRIPRN